MGNVGQYGGDAMGKQTPVWIAVMLALLVAGLVVFAYVAGRPSALQGALDPQEHAEAYASDRNGYRLYEAAAAVMPASDKALLAELEGLTVSGEASGAVREHLKRSAEALSTFRKGLEMELCIARPYDDSQEGMDMQRALRDLARTLVHEGTVHGIDGDSAKMLASFLDAYTLGYTVMKGGVLMDALFGTAIQKKAFDAIRAAMNTLTESDLQHLVKVLEMSEERRVTFPEVLAYERNAIPISLVQRIVTYRITQPVFDSAEETLLMGDVLVRGVALRARVRLYELEQGHLPDALSDVMGGGTVPIDPFSGKPFAFLNATIYSFGYDRDDDGGLIDARRPDTDGDRLF